MSHPRKRFKSDAERQTERRVRNIMNGLNTQGKPYQRHPNFVNRAESDNGSLAYMLKVCRQHKLANNLARYHRLAAANKAAGLRSDGKPFRRKQSTVTAQWQSLRSQIIVPPVSFEDFGATTRKGIYA